MQLIVTSLRARNQVPYDWWRRTVIIFKWMRIVLPGYNTHLLFLIILLYASAEVSSTVLFSDERCNYRNNIKNFQGSATEVTHFLIYLNLQINIKLELKSKGFVTQFLWQMFWSANSLATCFKFTMFLM